MTSDLKSHWVTLYTLTLPTLARSKAKSQSTWPVHLDHCFARIILDTVIGNSTSTRSDESSTLWTAKLKSPAVKNMSTQQLGACIELGEAIAEGKIDLVELDQRSLMARGKTLKGEKRKREEEDSPGSDGAPERGIEKFKKSSARSQQSDIRAAMGAPPPISPSPVPIDPALSCEIASHPTLTPFRKRVLLALCQVPLGSYTTYLALSNYLSSSPRAIGNALSNNPFAPRVPCHRVVAADGGIGGFGGEWGVAGKHNGEKVRLLKDEGVKVDAAGGRLKGSPWSGFR